MMDAEERASLVWMPHAGHFICGDRCSFKLNTYVPVAGGSGYIVSTIGELSYREGKPWQPIGGTSLYETMVFPAKPGEAEYKCCPYVMADAADIDCERYMTPEEAYDGHWRFIEKYLHEAPHRR